MQEANSSSNSPEIPTLSPEVEAATEAPTLAPESETAAETKEDPNEPAKRRVTFGRIELREYSRCLGNNPATTHGPPLSLGWSYNKTGTYDMEQYEEARPPRRVTNQMLVPGSVRELILLEQASVTKKQIQAVEQEVKAVRHRRQLTVAMQEFENWHVAAEFVKRRFRRLRTGISKEKEIQVLWENASKTLPKKKELSNTGPAYDSDGDSSTVSDSGFIPVSAPAS
eukprot:CAMPEP_0117019836 /NCGR_PEP_ID=MMETSP0472-20121206/15160_1 /TAXON_ID=693140 ORGANISM="Tiarina fusus, Strain LIS" /NCGR_SAMPLE_ID=MMETSP0472 /ASSEMBLY_ACC=CAM_ASM_000603 /LENGTH=225 /DNA_ID=CAMNT_0004724891 /DNA_START=22 /DNA_END=699 /DNA_ORIENTATION=+